MSFPVPAAVGGGGNGGGVPRRRGRRAPRRRLRRGARRRRRCRRRLPQRRARRPLQPRVPRGQPQGRRPGQARARQPARGKKADGRPRHGPDDPGREEAATWRPPALIRPDSLTLRPRPDRCRARPPTSMPTSAKSPNRGGRSGGPPRPLPEVPGRLRRGDGLRDAELLQGRSRPSPSPARRITSRFMINPAVVEAHRQELADASIGKSCIRFAKPEKLDLAVIENCSWRPARPARRLADPAGRLSDRNGVSRPMPVLDREEYIEQAYFFHAFRERVLDGMPAQDVLVPGRRGDPLDDPAPAGDLVPGHRDQGHRPDGPGDGPARPLLHAVPGPRRSTRPSTTSAGSRWIRPCSILEREAKYQGRRPHPRRPVRLPVRGPLAEPAGLRQGARRDRRRPGL